MNNKCQQAFTYLYVGTVTFGNKVKEGLNSLVERFSPSFS